MRILKYVLIFIFGFECGGVGVLWTQKHNENKHIKPFKTTAFINHKLLNNE